MADGHSRRNWGRVCLLLACGAAVMATGCGGEFSRERYDTIYVGQPTSAVRSQLGQPNETLRDAWIYFRRRPLQSGAILFDRGLVAGKLWSFERILTVQDIKAYRATLQPKPKAKPKAKRPASPPTR